MRTSIATEIPKRPNSKWTAKKPNVPETFYVQGGNLVTEDPTITTLTYGPQGKFFAFVTTIVYSDSTYPTNDTALLFVTDSRGTGVDLVFTVNVGGTTFTGTDTYAYPEIPVIFTVRGCSDVNGTNGTENCPTYGRTIITITGSGFVENTEAPLFADVGGVRCDNLTLNSSSYFTCVLPPGAGLRQPVRTFSLGFFSKPENLLSYGNPNITRLQGGPVGGTVGINACTNAGPQDIARCPRDAGTILTIQGTNFGAQGAVIILGTQQCTNVVHTDAQYHTTVQCTMPRGNQQHQPVLLIVERGEISQSKATIGYAQCNPGYYENSSSPIKLCTPCPVGSYSALEGAIGSCSPCPVGSISTMTGQSVCDPCVIGRYQDTPGKTNCTACPAGKFAGAKGLQFCQDCTPGKYNPPGGNSSDCSVCPQGRIQPASGKDTCDACPPGKTSTAELKTCAQCVKGAVAPQAASYQCLTCPTNSYSSESNLNCECDVGMYGQFSGNFTLENNPDKVECIACPVGANCQSRPIWRWDVPALPGYWHLTQDALHFETCLFDTHCPGQRVGTNDTGCQNFRYGLLCANCIPGYKTTGGASECLECPPTVGESWGWSLLFVIAIVFGLCVFYWILLRADATQDRAFTGKAGEVKLSSLPPILNMGDAAVLTTTVVLTEENQRTSRFTSTLKILVGFFQISTSLSIFNDVKLPSYYATFIGWFDVINLDFVPWTSLSCVANFNFFTKTLITGFIPITVLGTATALFFGWYRWANARDFSDDVEPRKRRKGYRLKFWKLLLFTLFLLYPSVSRSLLRYFVCREINFRMWLLADLNMPCSDGVWLDNLPYAVLFVLVYPIGIPVMFFVLMFRRRHKLRRVNTVATYSFLYQAYVEKMWFFEDIEMIHKLFMTSILQFFPGAMRFQAGMVVTYLYITTILIMSPYVQKKNEILAIICEVEIMLLLLAGNAMSAEGRLPVGSFLDVLLSVLLILATCGAVLLFFATAIHHARQNYWTKKRLNAERAGRRMKPKVEGEMSETSVNRSSKHSKSKNDDDEDADKEDLKESDNIKSAREAQEAMQEALQSTLAEHIAPFHVVVGESLYNIYDDIRHRPCCEVIMVYVHRCCDPCMAACKAKWDVFVEKSQNLFQKCGCASMASQFRRLTCGTCCEKRKAGKPKLYTSAMMELMLPEARHQRSASEHLVRAVHESTLSRADFHNLNEDEEEAKLETAVNAIKLPGSGATPKKSALKPSKDATDDSHRAQTANERTNAGRMKTEKEEKKTVVVTAPGDKKEESKKANVTSEKPAEKPEKPASKPLKPRSLTIEQRNTIAGPSSPSSSSSSSSSPSPSLPASPSSAAMSAPDKPAKPRALTIEQREELARTSESKPAKPQALTTAQRQTIVGSPTAAGTPAQAKPGETKQSASPKAGADAAAQLGARMAAKISKVSSNANLPTLTPAHDSSNVEQKSPTATTPTNVANAEQPSAANPDPSSPTRRSTTDVKAAKPAKPSAAILARISSAGLH